MVDAEVVPNVPLLHHLLVLLVSDMCELRLYLVFFFLRGPLPELSKHTTDQVLALVLPCLAYDQGSGSPATEPAKGMTAHAAAAITEASSSLIWTG